MKGAECSGGTLICASVSWCERYSSPDLPVLARQANKMKAPSSSPPTSNRLGVAACHPGKPQSAIFSVLLLITKVMSEKARKQALVF